MSKKTKIWLVIAASLVAIGGMIFGGAMSILEWDFIGLSTSKYETNSYEIVEDYTNVSIITKTSDIVFLPSDGSESSVVCYEQKNVKHSVSVENGTLVIKVNDTRKWYEHIGINFGTPKITVCLPKSEYGELLIKDDTGNIGLPKDFEFESIDITVSTGRVSLEASASGTVKIKASTGDISVRNVSADEIDLSVTTGKVSVYNVNCEGKINVDVSTGKVDMTDVACENLVSDGSTGGVSLKNVIASKKFSVERSTGDIKLEKCDAAEIFIETDTGDVKGSLLSEKMFVAKSDTGKVKVPKTSGGGRCEIETDTGNINITLE